MAIDWGWASVQRPSDTLRGAKAELDAYFDGDPVQFKTELRLPADDMNLIALWTEIMSLRYGEICTYEELSKSTGLDISFILEAVEDTPIPLYIPCHRLVHSLEDLGPYCGENGEEDKRVLLTLEGVIPPR